MNSGDNGVKLDFKVIAVKLKIDDWISKLYKKQASVSIKENNENFLNIPQCRLLNTSQNNIGIISKTFMERTCKYAKNTLVINQWRNTSENVE